MNIIKATLSDAEDIAKNNIAMAFESEKISLSEFIALDAVKNLINNPEKGFYLLIKQNNRIIGQLMITYEWSDWRNTTIWWIQSVYVDPAFRKQGVFRSLYEYIQKLSKKNNVKVLRLYVHEQNKNAIKVYESLGMKKKSYVIYESVIT